MTRDFSRLDNLIKQFADTKSVPGCGISIMQGDEIVYEGYAGYANIEDKTPVTRTSMFRQASTTKLFTYAIMGMLYEEGKFLFSDPISDYIPEWKNTMRYAVTPNGTVEVVPLEKPITIRHAVAMMCGMPYCMVPALNPITPTLAAMSREIGKLYEKGVPTLLDEARVMANAPVMFEPGSHWQYGFGSEITGALVEVFTGKPLREVFVDRIIDPLGLENTDTYVTDKNRAQLVTTYKKENGTLTPMSTDLDQWMDPDYMPVAGRPNLITTPNDFAVFMQMLANGGKYKGKKFMGEGTVNMLHETQLDAVSQADYTNDYLAGYGYGLGFRTLETQKYGHNGRLGCFGWTGGAGTWVEADPVDKLSIAYMHNMAPNEELYHHHRIRAVAYGCLL